MTFLYLRKYKGKNEKLFIYMYTCLSRRFKMSEKKDRGERRIWVGGRRMGEDQGEFKNQQRKEKAAWTK